MYNYQSRLKNYRVVIKEVKLSEYAKNINKVLQYSITNNTKSVVINSDITNNVRELLAKVTFLHWQNAVKLDELSNKKLKEHIIIALLDNGRLRPKLDRKTLKEDTRTLKGSRELKIWQFLHDIIYAIESNNGTKDIHEKNTKTK